MTKILRSSIALVLAFSLVTVGCQSKKSNRQDSTLVTAYKLIDDQREDEAIFLLEQELNKTPTDSPYKIQVKMALASAYAHKAGIKVQKFGPLLEVSKNKVEFPTGLTLRNKGTTSKSEAVDIMIRSIAGLITSFRLVMDYYTAIPTVKPADERYLDYAIRILDSLGKNVTQGQAMYRAVLNVVYLKNYLAAHVFDDGLQVNLDVSTCEIDFNKLNKSLERTAKISIQIVDDLALAQPSKSKNFQSLRKQLGDSVSDLTVVTTSASLLDETSMIFAKSAIVESGLRNLLKCRSAEKSTPVSH